MHALAKAVNKQELPNIIESGPHRYPPAEYSLIRNNFQIHGEEIVSQVKADRQKKHLKSGNSVSENNQRVKAMIGLKRRKDIGKPTSSNKKNKDKERERNSEEDLEGADADGDGDGDADADNKMSMAGAEDESEQSENNGEDESDEKDPFEGKFFGFLIILSDFEHGNEDEMDLDI